MVASTLQTVFGAFDYESAKEYCVSVEGFQVALVAAYVVAIWSIKFYMRERKPYDLSPYLNTWNAILAVFSILGMVYTTPVMFRVIREKGIQYTYTHISELQTDSSAGYWTLLWVLSKMPELVDTIFIVLRKRPLMFMHWYHHALTGWFALVNYYEDNAYMIWVVWLNYIIHSGMYSYYMLRSMRFKLHPSIAQFITSAQIVQFLITHAVMAHLAYLCMVNPVNDYAVTFKGWMIGAVMETTYLALWFRFYYISYYQKGGKKYVEHVNPRKIE